MMYTLMPHGAGSSAQFTISHKGMRDLVDVLRNANIFTSDDDGEDRRIPDWLFASNAGWHVTPDYCRIMALALDDFQDATDPAWEATVKQFANFVQVCADLDGFDVW